MARWSTPYLLRAISMLDYLAEMGLFRAYNLTLILNGAGTADAAGERTIHAAARLGRTALNFIDFQGFFKAF